MADEISDEEWGVGMLQKPGPLLRILHENGSRCSVQDKENSQVLTKLKEKRYADDGISTITVMSVASPNRAKTIFPCFADISIRIYRYYSEFFVGFS